MEISVEPSKTYAVTTSGSCTVTDADGLELCTASSGSQAFFVATTPTVTISDDGAKVSRATFNYALAVAGLLGGGADKLPAGYTRVEYLESTGTQYINVPRALTVAPDCTFVYKAQLTGGTSGTQHAFGARVAANSKEFGVSYNVTSSAITVMLGGGGGTYIPYSLTEPHEIKVDGTAGTVVCGDAIAAITPVEITMSSIGIFRRSGIGYSYFVGRIFKASIFNSGQKFMNMMPALDATGTPCMYDTVTKTAYKRNGSGQFIAGMTLAQVRALRLPAGGELTVSVPSDTPDSAVEQLRKNNPTWQIAIQFRTESNEDQ